MLRKKLFTTIFTLIYFLFVGLAYLPTTANAVEPVTATITTTVTAAVFLDKLEEIVKNAIADAGNQARSTVVVAGGQLLAVIENARIAYEDVLDQTMNDIDQEIRMALGELDILITHSIDKLGADVDKLKDGVDNVSNAINNSIFGSKAPRHRTPGPLVFISDDNKKEFLIKFPGNFLNNEKNFLKVLGLSKDVDPIAKIVTRGPNELIFALSKEQLNVTAADKKGDIVNRTLELQLFTSERKWWCLWLCKITKKQMKSLIRVSIVPKTWGKYQAISIQNVQKEKIKNYKSGSYTTGRSGHKHCTGRKSWTMQPESGFYFINGGQKFTPTAWNKSHGLFSSLNYTSHALTLTLEACPHHRHRNWYEGYVTARQVKKYTEPKQYVIENNILKSESDKSIKLPADTKAWMLKYFTIDNKEKIFTKSGANEYIEVSYDRISKILVVRPRIPKNLLSF